MRLQERNPWLRSLGVVLAVLALSGVRAGAEIVSGQAGSIVVFPKVIADGTRDTIIAITNTDTMTAFAHCEYVQGAGICRISERYCVRNGPDQQGCGASDECVVNWQTQNFDLILTTQQPTIWRVSTGRKFDPTLGSGIACIDFVENGVLRQECPGLFFTSQTTADPPIRSGNLLPPPGAPRFRGELRCIQTDVSGDPWGGNDLKGEAIIETLGTELQPQSARLGTTQISKYNSVNVRALNDTNGPNSDQVAKLNNVEYNACSEAVEISHFALGAGDPIAQRISGDLGLGLCDDRVPIPVPPFLSQTCPVRTEFTLIPCTQDYLFRENVGTRVTAQLNVWDEFEQATSANIFVDCWTNLELSQIGSGAAFLGNGSTFLRTVLRVSAANRPFIPDPDPAPVIPGSCVHSSAPCSSDADCGAGGICGAQSGILALVEEFYETDDSILLLVPRGTAATNAYLVSSDLTDDDEAATEISRVGRCGEGVNGSDRGGRACEVDGDCGDRGTCRAPAGFVCETDQDCVDECFLDPACSGDPLLDGNFAVCDRCMYDEMDFILGGF